MSVVPWRLGRHLAVMLGALVALLALSVASLAQGATADAPAVDPKELEQLIGTLEDPVRRARFIEQLRAIAQSADVTASKPASVDELGLGLVELLTERVNTFGQGLVDLSAVIVDLPDLLDWLRFQAFDPAARAYWYEFLGIIALVIALSVIAYRLVRRWLTVPMRQIEHERPESVAQRVPLLLTRAGLRLLPIAAFVGAGYSVLWLADGQFSTEIVATSLIHASVFSMVLLVGVRVLLSPGAPHLRLSHLSDEAAQYLYRWLKRFIYLVAFSYVIFQNELLLQIPASIYSGIERLLGLIVAVMAIVFILQNRKPVAHWLRGDGQAGGSLAITRRLVADIWPVFAIFYVLGTYLVWALEVPGGFHLLLRGAVATTLLIAMARPLAFAVERMLGQRLSVGPDFWYRYPALGRRINRYLALLQQAAGGVVYLVILLALVHVWGIDLFGWLGSMSGENSWDSLTNIGLVLLITWIIWELTSMLIENYLDGTNEGGTRVERSGRARTLLPLLRTFLLVLIAIVVILTAMSTLGVDITPLLAAAGVVGIAVGFGAQKLVQDVINGLFILFQDTISVGDVVNVGGHAGLVETISVRTIGLRDLGGNVHTIPFSEVTTITNMTKEFSYADLSIGVAYRENVDDIMEVVRQLGADLEADPEYGQYMLEPIEVLGVDAFADSAVIIKARIKTKSLKQWYVKREFNRLMKHRFDELGIEIPFPHQTLYFGEDKAGAAPPMHLRVDDEAATPVKATARRGKSLRVVKTNDPKSPIDDHE